MIMKFFVTVLTLTIIGAIGKAQGDEGSELEICQAGQGGGGGQGGLSGSVNSSVKSNEPKCGCKRKKKISASGEANIEVEGVSGSSDGSVETTTVKGGYAYTIQVERGSTATGENSVVYAPQFSQHDEDMNVTYCKRVDANSPLWIQGWLAYERTDIYTVSAEDPLNSCGEYEEGTWAYVVTSIFNLGMTPNGKCPIEPGTYESYPKPHPITFYFPEMVKCGKYKIWTYVENAFKQFAFEIDWYFTIFDDGTCVPKESK